LSTYDGSSESSSDSGKEESTTSKVDTTEGQKVATTDKSEDTTNEVNTTNANATEDSIQTIIASTIKTSIIETTIPNKEIGITIVPEPSNTPIILLGYSHFNKRPTFFTFKIYFIPILNFIYSKFLRFPISVIYGTRLRLLEEFEGNCTLEENVGEKNSKAQYSCEVQANTTNIKQIKIDPNFKFGSQNCVNLVGITPLANRFMDNIQEVGDNFNQLSNSTVYILDHSIYNKYDNYNFNISGEMKDPQPSFKNNTNFVLRINTNSTGNENQAEANCTIASVTGKNYTLNCKTNDDSDLDLQSAFSFVENDILLVNFDGQINNSTEDDSDSDSSTSTSSYSRRFFYKKSSGLKAGQIVTIVVVPIVALIALSAAIYFLRKNNADIKQIVDSQISTLNKV